MLNETPSSMILSHPPRWCVNCECGLTNWQWPRGLG